MKQDIKKIKEENGIAYDATLREQLKYLHQILGTDITDVAVSAMEYGIKFQPRGKMVLKVMSKLASDLSVALLEAKGERKLSEEEKGHFEAVKHLVSTLGNLQFDLKKIIKKVDEVNKLVESLSKMGMKFAESIMDAQDEFKEVRANINALSWLSNNPEIAYLFDSD